MRESEDKISAPEHLNQKHQIAAFNSGVPALDDWLKKRARWLRKRRLAGFGATCQTPFQ